jgi:hypothetical protein
MEIARFVRLFQRTEAPFGQIPLVRIMVSWSIVCAGKPTQIPVREIRMGDDPGILVQRECPQDRNLLLLPLALLFPKNRVAWGKREEPQSPIAE